jgi:predicted PurR-regulated permease PerM
LPRGLAVLLCYIVLLSAIALFFVSFLPRLSRDTARLGHEAPELWARVNDEWAPRLAHWLEEQFPSLAPEPPGAEPPPDAVVGEPPPPPGTVLTLTPLPSGDYAVALTGLGLEVHRVDDKIVLRAREEAPPRRLEDVLRARLLKLVQGLESQAGDLLRFGQAIIAGIATVVMTLFLVLMVAAFILIDLDKLHGFARGVIPRRYRDDYDVIVAGIDRGLSGVIRGQLIICLVNGVLTGIGLMIFDIKYTLLLSLIAGVMSLIPIFGSILSTIPIVALALVSAPDGVDLWKGIAILLWILGIHFLEANFLNPKILGTAAKMHPVLVIFALIAGEHTFGLVGALFAVPVASIIQTLFVYFRRQAWKQEGGSVGPSTGPLGVDALRPGPAQGPG